jgi:N-acetylglucosaminyldiphosphoundecaprenol N-acetyl-beta-D-mannosaminyltransferase
MQQLEKDKGTVFFLGASNDTLNKIEAKCKSDFPNITFGGYSPKYKSVFTEKDSKDMCEAVNFTKTRCVICRDDCSKTRKMDS